MSAILHCICEGIERDRVSIMINTWRIKQQEAKLAVITSMYKHFDTSMNTYHEDEGIDLWEELRDFNFSPVLCANYPKCKTGVYYTYSYKVYWDNGDMGWGIEEEDPNDYDYYCWGCSRQQRILKSSLTN